MVFLHRQLRVYRMAVDLAAQLYRATCGAPPAAWPIVRQLVRAVSSIALNIAEGAGEYSPREKARFYRIARRSAAETVAALDLLHAMNLIADSEVEAAHSRLDEMCAMLTGMIHTQNGRADHLAFPGPRSER